MEGLLGRVTLLPKTKSRLKSSIYRFGTPMRQCHTRSRDIKSDQNASLYDGQHGMMRPISFVGFIWSSLPEPALLLSYTFYIKLSCCIKCYPNLPTLSYSIPTNLTLFHSILSYHIDKTTEGCKQTTASVHCLQQKNGCRRTATNLKR